MTSHITRLPYSLIRDITGHLPLDEWAAMRGTCRVVYRSQHFAAWYERQTTIDLQQTDFYAELLSRKAGEPQVRNRSTQDGRTLTLLSSGSHLNQRRLILTPRTGRLYAPHELALKVLNIKYSLEELTLAIDFSVDNVVGRLKKSLSKFKDLRKLSLHHCPAAVVHALMTVSPGIGHIHLKGKIDVDGKLASVLQGRIVHIEATESLSTETIKHLALLGREIRVLKLCGDNEAEIKLLSSLPRLETLSLHEFLEASSRLLVPAVQALKRLQALHLSNCRNSYFSLFNSQLPITELGLTDYDSSYINKNLFRALAKVAPNLRKLNIKCAILDKCVPLHLLPKLEEVTLSIMAFPQHSLDGSCLVEKPLRKIRIEHAEQQLGAGYSIELAKNLTKCLEKARKTDRDWLIDLSLNTTAARREIWKHIRGNL